MNQMTPTSPRPQVELDAQYRALREEAGVLIDRDRIVLVLAGSEAGEFLQGQLTNEIEGIEAGSGCYAALLDRKGKMRSDMRVLRVTDETFWVETPVGPAREVERHLTTYKVGREVEIEASERAVVRMLGPRSIELLDNKPAGSLHSNAIRRIAERDCLVVATEFGVDLITETADDAETVRTALEGAGAAPVSVEAIDILRVEAGRPAFGREMGNDTIPQEAGINERAVSFSKGCYIGQETVARLHYKGKPNRHLRRLRATEPLTEGAEVSLDGKLLGTIGTAVISPATGPQALAILRREAEPGARVRVSDSLEAEVEATS